MKREGHSCGCPPFVTRCEHAGGLFIALVTATDVRAEYLRRTGRKRVGRSCAECGRHLRAAVTAIYGPAVRDSAGPDCDCTTGFRPAPGLDEHSAMRRISAAADLEPQWALASAALQRMSPAPQASIETAIELEGKS